MQQKTKQHKKRSHYEFTYLLDSFHFVCNWNGTNHVRQSLCQSARVHDKYNPYPTRKQQDSETSPSFAFVLRQAYCSRIPVVVFETPSLDLQSSFRLERPAKHHASSNLKLTWCKRCKSSPIWTFRQGNESAHCSLFASARHEWSHCKRRRIVTNPGRGCRQPSHRDNVSLDTSA